MPDIALKIAIANITTQVEPAKKSSATLKHNGFGSSRPNNTTHTIANIIKNELINSKADNSIKIQF